MPANPETVSESVVTHEESEVSPDIKRPTKPRSSRSKRTNPTTAIETGQRDEVDERTNTSTQINPIDEAELKSAEPLNNTGNRSTSTAAKSSKGKPRKASSRKKPVPSEPKPLEPAITPENSSGIDEQRDDSLPGLAQLPKLNWDLPPHGDTHLNIKVKISRNTSIALTVSLIIHALILIFILPKLLQQASTSSLNKNQTLVVDLSPPNNNDKKPPVSIPNIEPIKPKTVKKTISNHIKDASPNIMAIQNPEPTTSNPSTNPIVPPPHEQPSAPVDMMSYIRARRQESQNEEDEAAQENAAAAARERTPTAEELREANIKRNLSQPGTNGIFEIRDKGLHSAQFSFKGWKHNYSNARQEIFTVEAGPDGDIERAIVKKMIVIIRRDYNGDFNWESPRLGRVVILSARIEDNDALEDFLIREFFSH